MVAAHLYCDESGTMPVSDDGDVFVTAVVSFPKAVDFSIPDQRHSLENTVRFLKDTKAIPCCTYVKPYVGYGDDLAKKIAAFKFMSEVDRRQKRRREWFLEPAAVQDRNFVWLFSMMLTVCNNLVFWALGAKDAIENVRVFLDPKSLSAEMKALCDLILKDGIHDLARNHYSQIADNPSIAIADRKSSARAFDNIKDAVFQVEWKGTPTYWGDGGLLSLADGMATHTQSELRLRNRKPGFFLGLHEAGYRNSYCKNITRLLAEWDREKIRNWQKETGEKIPPWRPSPGE